MAKQEHSGESTDLLKYQAVFNEILDVVMITDGKEGRILEINRACSNLLGYAPEELIGKHFSCIIEDVDDSGRLLESTKFYGSVLAEKQVRRKDGSLCPMDITISIAVCEGEKVVVTTFRDVSERVMLDKELNKYAQQLIDLNATKDKFFSIIAHDLRSPFFGILGLSQILTEELRESGNKKLLTFSEELNKSANSVYKLLQNLLEWSRISLGNVKPIFSNINLASKISSVVQLVNLNASNKNIKINSACAGDVTVFADNNMLNSVLQNVLSNSIKFTQPGGSIYITASASGNKTIIKVKDTGIGMPPEKLAGLFKPGTNTTTPGTANERGTGLGLILCNELVQLNNGTINVESTIGEGSVFTITLPRKKM